MIGELCLNDALVSGAKEVFETMIFIDLVQAAPDQRIQEDSLLASITFQGDIEGCMAICCSMDCGKIIACNMLGMEPCSELSEEEVSDAMGEVSNMVLGSIKARIQKDVGNINVSIPSVVKGRMLENALGAGTSKVVVKFIIDSNQVAEFSLTYKGKK
ncbi:MAG: chemotaxis protein CheX [Candidatus Atribacteria bacterium]|nr:MAG: chemotaxis protein CheX [Candidatus Atribacteria bacterium]